MFGNCAESAESYRSLGMPCYYYPNCASPSVNRSWWGGEAVSAGGYLLSCPFLSLWQCKPSVAHRTPECCCKVFIWQSTDMANPCWNGVWSQLAGLDQVCLVLPFASCLPVACSLSVFTSHCSSSPLSALWFGSWAAFCRCLQSRKVPPMQDYSQLPLHTLIRKMRLSPPAARPHTSTWLWGSGSTPRWLSRRRCQRPNCPQKSQHGLG